MRSLVEALCSDRCAGREAGSPGVVLAMMEQGLAQAG